MKKIQLQDKTKELWMILGILVFWILYYQVVINSSFTADDRLNAVAAGVNYINGDSVWALTGRQFGEWIKVGRFFPFANYTYLLFAYVPSRACYKILLILSLFLGSLLFAGSMVKLTNSRYLGYALMMIIPLCMQLTGEFGSALYCYQMLVQITWIWMNLSLICALKVADIQKLQNAGKGRKIWYGILGGLTLILALGTYEVAFVLTIFIFLTVWAYTRELKQTMKVLVPQFIAFFLIAAINIVLRLQLNGVEYSGVSIHMSIPDIVTTFLKQLWSMVPMARFISRTVLYGVPYGKWDLLRHLQWTDILLTGLLVGLLLCITRWLFAHSDQIHRKKWLFGIGIAIMLLPPALISLTAKYQTVLDWGMGHISGLLQSFGFALTVLSGVLLIADYRPKAGRIIMLVLIFLNVPIVLMQEMEARTAVDLDNLQYRYPYENVQAAGELGIFEDLDSDTPVILLTDYYFDKEAVSAFYALAARKSLNVMNPQTAETVDTDVAYYIWSYADETQGYVILGEDDVRDGKTQVNRMWVYSNDSSGKDITFTSGGKQIDVSLNGENPVKIDRKGAIYVLEAQDIDIRTIQIHSMD